MGALNSRLRIHLDRATINDLGSRPQATDIGLNSRGHPTIR
jgi:hypothetical protein